MLTKTPALAALVLDSTGDGVLAFDRECRYTVWNRAMERISGVAASAVLTRRAFDVFPFLVETGEDQCFAAALEGRTTTSIDRPYRIPETGREGFFEAHYSPLVDGRGAIVGGVGVIRDVTARRNSARLTESRFQAVLDQSPLSTQIVSPDGVIVRANAAWEALWGVKLEAIAADYNMWRDPQLEALGIMPLMRRALAGETVEIPAVPYDPNATLPDRTRHTDPLRWVRAFAYPIRNAGGDVIEMVLVQEDITEARRAQERLKRSEERLRLALAAARMNVWDWDLKTDTIECSDNAREFWGIDVGHSADFMAVIHPDDVALVAAAAENAIASAEPYHCEYRLRREAGTVRWVQSRGRVERDAAGRAYRILGVTVDISDLKAAEERLRDDDRRKDEFLATLAHELRNPLAPIRTGVQLLRLTDSAEYAEQTRQVIDRQLDHLVRLIDDLLDLSRVTRGKVQLQRERVDLWTLVSTTLEVSRPQIASAGLQLSVQMPQEPLMLDGDRTRLAQVLSNILNNAAKYTERGGRIEVHARRDGQEAEIRVSDNGVGIPHDMLTSVFEMFTQVERSISRSQGGLGIGLTLVRGLVELHGGRVWAESEGPGQGTTIVVRLPIGASDGAPTAVQDFALAPIAVAHPRRVLVVDDNADAAETLAQLLQLSGYDVRQAASGEEALAIARTFEPEVVFLDIGMPDMSGHDVARELRVALAKRVTLIAVTGWGQAEDRRRSTEAGFDRHLTKPVDPREILAILQSLP